MPVFRRSAPNAITDLYSPDHPWWEPPSVEGALRSESDTGGHTARRPLVIRRGPVDSPTTHLLLLRAFIAFGWLRTFTEKVGDASWWNGDAIERFLKGGAPAQPMTGADWVGDALLVPLSMPVGWAVLALELVIGLAILTGTRFDAALGTGIVLAAAVVALGQINPAAFYVVIQAALLGSPAGDVYTVDWWLRPRTRRWAGWVTGPTALVGIAAFLAADGLSPASVGDPAAVVGFLALFTSVALGILWRTGRNGPEEMPSGGQTE